jgi:hypothetical protein
MEGSGSVHIIMDRDTSGAKSIGSRSGTRVGIKQKENGLVEVILGNTESTEGSKQRISLIIICANTMVNNERGAP